MANDSQRDKARAMFGAAFFENSKAQPLGKQTNSMQALQKRANARPIPTYKVGGAVKKNPEVLAERGAKRAMKAEQDFSGLLGEAADRAARKGMPVMKQGGPTDEYTAKRVRARMEAGNYKDGGEVDRYKGKLDRKKADIEKDYQKALAKGKNADVAKAKYEQRMADAADDYAKWTKGDRSATKAAEKAAEKNLSMTRKSARNSPSGSGAKTSEALVKKAEESMSQPLSSTGPVPAQKISVSTKSKAPARKAAAPVRRSPAPKVTGAAPKAAAPAPKTEAPRAAGLKTSGIPFASARNAQRPMSLREASAQFGAPKKTQDQQPKGETKVRSSGILFQSARGKNVPKEPTMDQKRAARLAEFKAAAEKPNATGYEKDRYKRAVQTGMLGNFKSGGSVGKYAAGGAGKVRKGQAPVKKGK